MYVRITGFLLFSLINIFKDQKNFRFILDKLVSAI